MKFKSLLIMGITILSLGTVSGFTVATHADPTPAERNASLAVDNALTQKYGSHVPTSASIKAENDLDRDLKVDHLLMVQLVNHRLVNPVVVQNHSSQPTTSNKNVNTSSNNSSNKSNNSNNKTKNSKS